ncbi:Late embryogenesis abundant protein, LEA-14 [Spatholobus suberectus]|nr:Late embryogenesis abundant protein, LEA-14 [Spatholobus suberectus]
MDWNSIIIKAVTVVIVTTSILKKPKDPTFNLVSTYFSSLKLNYSLLEADLFLTFNVANPNIVPAHYSSITVSIFYEGSFLGSTDVQGDSQPPESNVQLHLLAYLPELELADHATRFVHDVVRRRMVLDVVVDVVGTSRVFCWEYPFKVRVDGSVDVDPYFLDVLASSMEVYTAAAA